MMAAVAISYLATGLAFLALDALWLGTMASRLYRPQLGDLMLDGFRLGPAALFYVLYVAGIVFFAVQPGWQNGRWITALQHGALVGLMAYGTYNLTNLATLKGWSLTVTIADMAWGSFATAMAAVIGFLAMRLVLGGR